MTFLTELARLKAAAGNTQAYSSNHYSRDSLKSFLFNRADAIEALAKSADAVVKRWDTPNWKDAPATANFIYALRDALAALDAAGKG